MSSIEDKAMAAVMKHVREQGIGRSLTGYDPNGEAEGFVDHPSDLQVGAGTELVCKDIADLLVKHYPGFQWAIQPSEFGGVFNIYCLNFSGRYGYRIRMADIVNDAKRREAVRAGGEILKRFGYHGSSFRPELMAEIKRNAKGEAIPNLSDKKNDRFKKRAELELALATGRAHIIGTKDGMQVVQVEGNL